mmetsp:Transcript_22465/g.43719  ORF Transcript_22465/g.43719 Transcript_22465/m.43719 type:complete len:230 (+) Transcript_22465:953-1642(+)
MRTAFFDSSRCALNSASRRWYRSPPLDSTADISRSCASLASAWACMSCAFWCSFSDSCWLRASTFTAYSPTWASASRSLSPASCRSFSAASRRVSAAWSLSAVAFACSLWRCSSVIHTSFSRASCCCCASITLPAWSISPLASIASASSDRAASALSRSVWARRLLASWRAASSWPVRLAMCRRFCSPAPDRSLSFSSSREAIWTRSRCSSLVPPPCCPPCIASTTFCL